MLATFAIKITSPQKTPAAIKDLEDKARSKEKVQRHHFVKNEGTLDEQEKKVRGQVRV